MWDLKDFSLLFSALCLLSLWCFKHGSWNFFASGELVSRISLEVHGGHWQVNLSCQPLIVMKAIIEITNLAPILSRLAASVFFANTVSQGLEIYHGYYLLFLKLFPFYFLSFIWCKLFPSTKKAKSIVMISEIHLTWETDEFQWPNAP